MKTREIDDYYLAILTSNLIQNVLLVGGDKF
jgi:hypothetical protein